MLKFENLNKALIGLSRLLIKEGVKRHTRGFDCIEINEPLLICIENPLDRYINIPERRWGKTLPFIESLWIASGVNSIEMVSDYTSNLLNFSDDGQFMRAGYGPRIRAFSGIGSDYKVDSPNTRGVVSGLTVTVDQLKFVIDMLKKDINSRQALITIHDPAKDTFDGSGNLKVTKDMPCCRTLQFMVVDGKLNCTLTIRSNDVIWGFSAVNVFNFTWMQEYIANIIGVPVGKYYHFVNNLHYYSDKDSLVRLLSNVDESKYDSEFGRWQYKDSMTFEQFDNMTNALFEYEWHLRNNNFNDSTKTNFRVVFGQSDMFHDWLLVLYKHWSKSKVEFINPYLNKLFYGK